MAWRYVRHEPELHDWSCLVDGYRVAYCRGFDEDQGKLCVVVCTERPGKQPRAMKVAGWPVDAFVRTPYMVGRTNAGGLVTPAGTSSEGPLILKPGLAYFTPTGWVDQRSLPIAHPFEIGEQ